MTLGKILLIRFVGVVFTDKDKSNVMVSMYEWFTTIESIFFIKSGTANRIFETLWDFPNIPQKSVAVVHWNRKRTKTPLK